MVKRIKGLKQEKVKTVLQYCILNVTIIAVEKLIFYSVLRSLSCRKFCNIKIALKNKTLSF